MRCVLNVNFKLMNKPRNVAYLTALRKHLLIETNFLGKLITSWEFINY